MSTERVTVDDVRRACGGDEQFAAEVFELLDREGNAAQEEERAAIVKKLEDLSSVEKAKIMVEMCGYPSDDPGHCVLAESILDLASDVVRTGKPEEL